MNKKQFDKKKDKTIGDLLTDFIISSYWQNLEIRIVQICKKELKDDINNLSNKIRNIIEKDKGVLQK